MNALRTTPCPPATTLTRAELYARVWTTPMLRLASEFGVSDVAIAKLCRRRNIPRPAPGHWAKLAAGRIVEQPALPPATPKQDRPIVFRHATAAMIPLESATRPAVLHPIAERVHRCLSRYKARAHGLVLVSEPDLPRVLASPAQAARISVFLHALLAGAAARAIGFSADAPRTPSFHRAERRAIIRIEESLCSNSPEGRTPRRPSGRLVVVLRGPNGARRDVERWEESDTLPLVRIGQLVLGTLQAKLVPRVVASPAIFPRRPRFKRAAPTQLLREARRWEHSSLLQRYVAACETRWTHDESGLTPARDAWLAWAKSTVHALSPFTNHPADQDVLPGVVVRSPELFAASPASSRQHSC